MQSELRQIATILLVEDDEEDRWTTQRAFQDSSFRNHVFVAENGRQALDFLRNEGDYDDAVQFPRPDLILLDLNLPIVDGREVLREIKQDPSLRRIPVVVLTTSKQEEDILRSYDLGVNSYLTKPVSFEKFTAMVRGMERYWLELVVLPPKT